jgi:hypothetical protein
VNECIQARGIGHLRTDDADRDLLANTSVLAPQLTNFQSSKVAVAAKGGASRV